ncbi:MAG: PqqD family protein [Paludibacter sp.]|jgi:hypothetical protein|nr:PqqD family protein [Paludibacter sp.]
MIINEEKIYCDTCADRSIVINSDTGIYYGINGLSSEVFNLLAGGTSVSAILDALKKIPEVPADIEQRLQHFIAELIEKEIFIESITADNEVVINPLLAENDNFTLLITEYADAREMLLADPVHDIDEDLGWQPNQIE